MISPDTEFLSFGFFLETELDRNGHRGAYFLSADPSRFPVRRGAYNPYGLRIQKRVHTLDHPDVTDLAVLSYGKIDLDRALDSVLHGLFRIAQILVNPLAEELARIGTVKEGRPQIAFIIRYGPFPVLVFFDFRFVAEGYVPVRIRQLDDKIVDILQLPFHHAEIDYRLGVPRRVVLRITSGGKMYCRYFLRIESPVVGRIDLIRPELRIYRLQLAGNGSYYRIQIRIGSSIGVDTVIPNTEQVQFRLRIYLDRISK